MRVTRAMTRGRAAAYPSGITGARTVACPKCGQPAGARCLSLRPHTQVYLQTCHPARRDVWREGRK